MHQTYRSNVDKDYSISNFDDKELIEDELFENTSEIFSPIVNFDFKKRESMVS